MKRQKPKRQQKTIYCRDIGNARNVEQQIDPKMKHVIFDAPLMSQWCIVQNN